jgi:hypothetical protein
MPGGCSHREHPGAEAEGHWPGIVVGAPHCSSGQRRPGAPPGACPVGQACRSQPHASMRQRRPLPRKQPVGKSSIFCAPERTSAQHHQGLEQPAQNSARRPCWQHGTHRQACAACVEDCRSGPYPGRCGWCSCCCCWRQANGRWACGRAARLAAFLRRGRLPARPRARRARHRAPARLPGAGLRARAALCAEQHMCPRWGLSAYARRRGDTLEDVSLMALARA